MGMVKDALEEDDMVRMMEWENAGQEPRKPQQQPQQIELQSWRSVGGGGLYVKVMTDEQMELLRRQISVYATICEQLVEMHKAISAQQDLSGMRLGNLLYDPLMTSAGQKITARQRWTPTPVQFQILERIFDEGNGAPGKQKIKDITNELTQHGPVSETNVYNWFQNRRARSKRKQLVLAPNNVESEVETNVEFLEDKKPENIQSHENSAPRAKNIYFPSPEISTGMHCLDAHPHKGESMFPPDHGSRFDYLDQFSSYVNVLSNPRVDQLIGKMEDPGNYSPYEPVEGYDMIG